MLTDYLRDQAFAIAWLALMGAGWFGWAQEDPKPKLRPLWGAGSVVGFLISIAFGIVVWRNWTTPTALEGQYWLFGIVVIAEIVLIGGGCLMLARRKQVRWCGWWIGLCVSLHFIPLAWVFSDWSYLLLTAVQATGLLVMLPALRRADYDEPLGLPLDRRHLPTLRGDLGRPVPRRERLPLNGSRRQRPASRSPQARIRRTLERRVMASCRAILIREGHL